MKLVYTCLAITSMISAPFAQSYILKSYCIDDGGTARVTSSNYIMGGSISQRFIGRTSTGNYITHIGYWTPIIMPYPGINETDNSQNPASSLVFSLNQNYPNPVASHTIIKYSIPKPCKVKLRLFDVTGRQIAILVDENQKPGYYQVKWNIHNASEKRLPNGVYFYQFTAGESIKTRKLVITR